MSALKKNQEKIKQGSCSNKSVCAMSLKPRGFVFIRAHEFTFLSVHFAFLLL